MLPNDWTVIPLLVVADDRVVVFLADKAALFPLPMIFEHMVNDAAGKFQPSTDRGKVEIARVARPVPTVPHPRLSVAVNDLDSGRCQFVIQRFEVFADHRHRTA